MYATIYVLKMFTTTDLFHQFLAEKEKEKAE